MGLISEHITPNSFWLKKRKREVAQNEIELSGSSPIYSIGPHSFSNTRVWENEVLINVLEESSLLHLPLRE